MRCLVRWAELHFSGSVCRRITPTSGRRLSPVCRSSNCAPLPVHASGRVKTAHGVAMQRNSCSPSATSGRAVSAASAPEITTERPAQAFQAADQVDRRADGGEVQPVPSPSARPRRPAALLQNVRPGAAGRPPANRRPAIRPNPAEARSASTRSNVPRSARAGTASHDPPGQAYCRQRPTPRSPLPCPPATATCGGR